METVVTDGITYTKASVIAKRFHYTSDYVGQLCRSGKATCQLIGRSWYVDENSLVQHKDSRYKEIRLDEIPNNKAVESTSIIEKVYPRPDAKDVRLHTKRELHAFASVPVSIARYHEDNAELLPQPLRRISPVIPIAVELDEATKVSVESDDPKRLTLEFTPLPEVPLQGGLTVQSVGFDSDDDELDEYDVVTEAELEPDRPVAETTPSHTTKVHIRSKEMSKSAVRTKKAPAFEQKLPAFTERLKNIEVTSVPAPISFTPILVSARKQPASSWGVFFVLVGSALSLCAFLLLSSHVILVGRYDVSSRVVFTTSVVSAVQTFLP